MSPTPADGSRELPKVDFSTFILSLATAALYQLGAIPDPGSGEAVPADPLVNLSEEERKLIDSLLYDLRLRIVELER
jgi:hypothetical protein